MYDIFAQQAIETARAAPATRTIWTTPESISRRASFSSSPSKRYHHHKSSSMSRSSDPSLRRLNAPGMPGERPRAFDRNDSSSSRIPRPFVPEMKRMMPLILNPAATSPKLEVAGYNPHIPCLPPEGIESAPKSPMPENRHREPSTPQDIAMHNAKHPFDATDHVIMRMEFVRPDLDIEELWIECFERWSRIHRKATADQWRWLYENRVLPTESMATFPTNSFSVKVHDRDTSPARPLKSSRSLGLIERSHKHQLILSSRASSLAARRRRKNAVGSRIPDFDKTPTPAILQSSRPSYILDRDTGYYANNGHLSPLYYKSEEMSVRVADRDKHNVEELSGDETNTDGTESTESNFPRPSIDTTATSTVSQKSSRTRLRGESLSDHITWTCSDSTLRLSSEKAPLQLDQELESCFETDSDDEDDEELISLSSGSSRNSISSFNDGFVPTPLTAVPARAYSNAQKVQVWRTSSQSSGSEIHLSLMPGGLRIPRARSVPMSTMRNQPKIAPWVSTLNTPPMSPEHYSNILEYNQNLLVSVPPRTSSLIHSKGPPTTPQMRYSTYSDDSDLTSASPSLAPSDHIHSDEEDNFATPTQESVLQHSHRDLPKVRLDVLMKTSSPSQTSSASYIHPTLSNIPKLAHPPVLPSQIDSFSSEDEDILHGLEKAVCSIPTTLCLATPCISQMRITSHSKLEPNITHPNTPTNLAMPRYSLLPHQFHKHPLKSHPPNLPAETQITTNRNPITRLFAPSFHNNQQAEVHASKIGKAILNASPRGRRNEREFTTLSHTQERLRTTPSPPDLSSFRIIFPSTSDSKRDELYAYLLAYNYLIRLPKPLSSARAARRRGDGGLGSPLRSPFSSKTEFRDFSGRDYDDEDEDNDGDDSSGFPKLPTPETLVTEKAAATLGIMSSEDSLRSVRLEHLTAGLIERVKEGISRLVAEMDVNVNVASGFNAGNKKSLKGGGGGMGGCMSGGGRGRDEGYVVESTLLRTLVEHVGVCEENGWLSEENGGLWKRILVRVREGMGIGVGVG